MSKIRNVDKQGFFRSKGFTLIEILIAMFVFSLVVSMVFISFREIAFSAGIVNKSNDDYEMAYGCFEIMRRDLASVYVSQKPAYVKPETDSDPDPCRFTGGKDHVAGSAFPRIRFTSRSHLPVNRDSRKGVAEIVYYTDESDDYGTILRRSDRVYFDEEFVKRKTHPVVLRKINAMAVTYYDEEGNAHEEWNSDSEEYGYASPSVIKIRVEIVDDERILPFETSVVLRSVREKTD